jgi:hypothetical protein
MPVWFAYYKKDLANRKLRLVQQACSERVCRGIADPLCDQLFRTIGRFVETPPPPRKAFANRSPLTPFYLAPEPTGVIEWTLRIPIGMALAKLRAFVGKRARMAASKGQAGMEAERTAIKAEARAQYFVM